MDFVVSFLGQTGLIIVIGIAFFMFTFKYSVGIFEWIENQTFGTRNYIMEKLELLHIEMKPEKITYILLGVSFGAAAFVLLIFGILSMWGLGIFAAIVVAFLGWKIPKPFINHLMKRRIKAYQGQMVDGLTLLSNGIRAGLSVPQALGMVVSEMKPPISQEFNSILQQNKIGVPLEDCFDSLVQRIPTEDNQMFVAGVNILRETGGNLAETFDTIVGIIRERIRVQQKIDSYVAQGLFQGATIFAMPFAIGTIYFVSEPETMMPLFTHPIGIIMLLLAVGLDCIGGIIIVKIVKIKV